MQCEKVNFKLSSSKMTFIEFRCWESCCSGFNVNGIKLFAQNQLLVPDNLFFSNEWKSKCKKINLYYKLQKSQVEKKANEKCLSLLPSTFLARQ